MTPRKIASIVFCEVFHYLCEPVLLLLSFLGGLSGWVALASSSVNESAEETSRNAPGDLAMLAAGVKLLLCSKVAASKGEALADVLVALIIEDLELADADEDDEVLAKTSLDLDDIDNNFI